MRSVAFATKKKTPFRLAPRNSFCKWWDLNCFSNFFYSFQLLNGSIFHIFGKFDWNFDVIVALGAKLWSLSFQIRRNVMRNVKIGVGNTVRSPTNIFERLFREQNFILRWLLLWWRRNHYDATIASTTISAAVAAASWMVQEMLAPRKRGPLPPPPRLCCRFCYRLIFHCDERNTTEWCLTVTMRVH